MPNKKKILIIEDNVEMQSILLRFLEQDGYSVSTCSSAEEGLKSIKSERPDLLVLDINLPGMSGFDLLRQMKGSPYLPVIIVTARNEDTEKVIGLELGADDYLTKPFNPLELGARVRAVLRRIDAVSQAGQVKDLLVAGNVELNWAAQRLRIGEIAYDLSLTEASLLRLLMQNKGRVISREQILDQVWGEEFVAGLRVVDVHVSNLRKKLAAPEGGKQYIQAVRGVGYRFEE